MDEELKQLLERIAGALERIADCLTLTESGFDAGSQEKARENAGRTAELQAAAGLGDPTEVKKFLESRGIQIKSVKEWGEEDRVPDRIALFMGKRYNYIKNLYSRIKKALNKKNFIRMDLKDRRPEEIGSITQLCHDLHEIAFLTKYSYDTRWKNLTAEVNLAPDVINFFTGGWLERCVRLMVIKAVKSVSNSVPISCLQNVEIKLPDGQDFELDLIFKIGDEHFWFEAKTGDYQKYIDKYSKMSDLLGLDCKHAYMVLTDIAPAGAAALCSLFKMSVVRLDDFYETFSEAICHLSSEQALSPDDHGGLPKDKRSGGEGDTQGKGAGLTSVEGGR